jgi:anhydro-N-acetylmuramic acid kinase
LIVAGVMSGTSADGVDVALVRLRGRGLRTRFELLAHGGFPYPAAVRAAVLEAMDAPAIAVSTLARLNFLLAELYADCVLRLQRRSGVACELVGCHGQTLYHQGEAARFLGRNIACTWQIGDGSVLAQRLGVPVVSDFRPADMAAGGLGAPLVPFLDLLVFRHPRRGRIVQNIGGIANLTAIPAGARAEQVRAFDTGPGNMVIDAVCQELFGLPMDKGGKLAARGKVLEDVVAEAMKDEFFRRKGRHVDAPRTAGREQFGREYVRQFLQRCGQANKHDVLATATALTAYSIAEAIYHLAYDYLGPDGRPWMSTSERRRIIEANAPSNSEMDFSDRPKLSLRGLRRANRPEYDELFVSGGGTRNRTLMAMIRDEVGFLDIRVSTTDAAGVPSQAKEAIAFAVLAYQSWHGECSNLPGATGASREVILGKVSYA